MVAYLAYENGLGILVERILVVSARAPEMVLGQVRPLASILESLLTEIRGTGQVRPGRIELIEYLGDHLAADYITVGIDVEGRKGPEQGVVILVVSRPDCEGRVTAELDHDLLYLIPQLGNEPVVLRVYDSGHGEVLPDHYTLTVAAVIERRVLVDISSPAADHVAVEVDNHVESTVHPSGVTAVEAVQRHPVGSAYEYPFSVDEETEFSLAILYHLAPVQPDSPKSHLAGVRSQDGAVLVDNAHGTVVKRRIAIALRPPQFCLVQLELGPPGESGKYPLHFICRASVLLQLDVQFHLVYLRCRILDLYVDECRHVSSGRIGIDGHPMHVGYADGVLDDQGNIPPQAGADQPGHNVPAIAVAGLADPDRLGVVPETVGPDKFLLGLEDSGAEHHL